MIMTLAEAFADQIEKSITGPAWYGLSVVEAISDVNAEEALFRLDEGSHSIWQQVWHLNNWIGVFHNRLNGKETPWLPEEEDWPSTEGLNEREWKKTQATMIESHKGFVEVARKLSDSQLNEQVPGKDYSFGFMLQGITQHVAYHTGQIVLVKKHLKRIA
jgi:uncharacterized damage-inducible protein DinB